MAGTPEGPFVLPERPKGGLFVDYIDLDDTVGSGGLSINRDPVLLNNCLPVACEHTVQARRAMLVDFVGTKASGKAGVPPTVTPVGDIPVLGYAPPECCEGDKTIVPTKCAPTNGTSKDLILQVILSKGFEHCRAPGDCQTVTLTNTGGSTWEGGPIGFKGGDMGFRLECSDRGAGPEWKLTGSGCGSFEAWTGTVCTNPAVFMLFNNQPIGGGCCDWPLQTQEISGIIIGACSFVRVARFVDIPDGIPGLAFTRCCDNFGGTAAPTCCERLPKVLVAQVTSSCATFDGATFTLTAGDSGAHAVWYGELTKDGTTITCALSCSPHIAGNAGVSPCPSPYVDVFCDPDGYEGCSRRVWQAGAMHVNLTCKGVSNPGVFGGGTLCKNCNCNDVGDPLDITITGTLTCADSGGPCCCAFIGQEHSVSVRITE